MILRRLCSAALCLTAAGLLGGCEGLDWGSKRPEPRPENPTLTPERPAGLRGTIGEVTYVQGILKMRVRGYGLVAGLGENGSRSCPDHIRKRVATELRKKQRIGDSRIGLGHVTAEQLIADRDTAVVQVVGEIGAGALRGKQFDLLVQALPGSETLSLEGGRLYACDLRYFRNVDERTVQEGKVIAQGGGPVFLLPKEGTDPENLQRAGMIIGGGVNQEDRRISLRLVTPSYAMSVQIQDRINTRFGEGERIATADSPGLVSLRIPPDFLNHELDFVERVRHLFIEEDAAYTEQRATELIGELRAPDAPHDGIGLALEGIGQTVRPTIRGLYDHELEHVRFIASRTGLRLGDELACGPLKTFSLDRNSVFQIPAIEELGRALHVRRAERTLAGVARRLVGDEQRLAAYEGLLRQGNPILDSRELGNQLVVDYLPTAGEPLVYAKTDGQTRLVVMGDGGCHTPVFYKHPRGLVRISASGSDTHLTVVRRTPTGRLSPPAHCETTVLPLIELLGGRARQNRRSVVTGLGVPYSQVIEILRDLSADGSLSARFILEDVELISAPEEERDWVGRPDSEL